MKSINLRDNIWIEGFERKSLIYDRILQLGGEQDILYKGKTSEIPEDLAKKCVHFYFPFDHDYTKLFKDYLLEDESINNFNTAKESIQSACDKEYCIIYKTK